MSKTENRMIITHSKWKDLLSYYISAIHREKERSITFIPTALNKSIFNVFTKETLFSSADAEYEIISSPDLKYFFDFVEKSRLVGSGNFYYGYPLLWTLDTSIRGTKYTSIRPVMLSKVTISNVAKKSVIKVEDTIPNVNEYIFRQKNIDFEIINLLVEEISDRITEHQLAGNYKEGITESVNRFCEILAIPFFSPLDYNNLNHIWPDPNDQNSYFLNDAIIYYSNTSDDRTTASLVKELELLKREDYYHQSSQTALMPLFTQKVDLPVHLNHNKVLLTFDVNKSQAEAITKAINSSLTVVGGPPGTGKSQVVLNLISSLIYNNLSGILISKNNPAVNIISNQFYKAYLDFPVLLRVGNLDYRKDAVKTLKNFRDTLKSFNSDEVHLKELISTYQKFYDDIWKNDQKLLEKLNLADKWAVRTSEFENEFEKLKENEKKWVKDAEYDDEECLELLNRVKELELWGEDIKKINNSGFIVKILKKIGAWFRGRSLDDLLRDVKSLAKKINYPITFFDSSPDSIIAYLRNVLSLLRLVDASNENKKMLKDLESLPNNEELLQHYESNQDEMIKLGKKLLEAILKERYYMFRSTDEANVRLDDFIRVHEQLISGAKFSTESLRSLFNTAADNFPSIRSIIPCWASSSLSAKMFPLKAGLFDLLIVDEASQCDIASIIPFLFRAKRVVIIGDKNQLRHIVNYNDNTDVYLANNAHLTDLEKLIFSYKRSSIYDLAARAIGGTTKILQLDEHYRSHPDIINFSNRKYYAGYLKIYTKVNGIKLLPGEHGIEWIDVRGKVERLEKGSSFNKEESLKVYEAVMTTISKYKSRDIPISLGIISPLRAQVDLLATLFSQKNKTLNDEEREYFDKCLKGDISVNGDGEPMIDTVHRFQGNERDIIIFSPVASEGMDDFTYNFINDRAQLNVAITRARSQLIIVGNKEYCRSRGNDLGELVEYVENLSTPKYNQDERTQKIESPIEKILYDAMIKKGLTPIVQYNELGFRLDFAIIQSSLRIGIECMGTQFHLSADGDMLKSDKIRLRKLNDAGWKMFVFWSWEIKNNPAMCVKKILDFIELTKTSKIVQSEVADDPFLKILDLPRMFSVAELESRFQQKNDLFNADKFVGYPAEVIKMMETQKNEVLEAYKYFINKYSLM